MSILIQMDASGRLVLPKAVRDQLKLRGKTMLRLDVVAGRVEIAPIAEEHAALRKKRGIKVLRRTGVAVDVAAAVSAEREEQEARGRRR